MVDAMIRKHSESSSPFELSRQRRPRLLVVDDQPVNIQVIHQIFVDTYEVFMATSGEQALAFCQSTPPDLVLLDVVMQGMDGLEVCRRLKQQPDTQDIPVIFVTGHEQLDDETACWEAGGVDFVNKPVNPTTLRNRVRAHLTLKLQADLLREMAFVDGLTGVANRRFFDERLEAEWRRCSRSQLPLALIMVDVDFFKHYNDRYGHQVGDDCLRRVATALKLGLKRPYDLVARYGGEEFVCIVPDTDLAGASAIAHSLEREVRALQIEHADSTADKVVTISLGIGFAQPGAVESAEVLVGLADAQLYRAKQEGRSRVCSDLVQEQ
jgi:diguanylate cyclase (GGDEF)-like protein